MAKKIAAFFDIDGTLYRDSLMTEHFKKLIKYEILDNKIWVNDIRHLYQAWDNREDDYDGYLFELSNKYVQAITGLEKSTLDFVAEQVIKLKADRVYKYTRNIIKKHKEQGHLVFFISGSPDFLVEKMGEKHEVFLSVGSGYIIKDNIFTGKVIPMWDSQSKNNMIDELIATYEIDLENSYAYGDTNGDYEMLSRVGNPVAINPSSELLTNIKNNKNLSQKIDIIIERKDVIYSLKDTVKTLEI
ncbi:MULTISPECIES: HAD family phosphatase [unclassified Gemella]|uniref:HAD family hydrolase n=1 Tax=unclassified Gemella TaxID=2624949 RepID=UPI001C03CB9B|nr:MULTISPECIES: HAD-IB family hydrolase [unclassified Gemella]MBU0278767.1 HAD-IB family hydrolase [Gemella sp. zg-1178]QWQ38707.1 HAD-IB family hydrolase [Gemella sp. zg-570]